VGFTGRQKAVLRLWRTKSLVMFLDLPFALLGRGLGGGGEGHVGEVPTDGRVVVPTGVFARDSDLSLETVRRAVLLEYGLNRDQRVQVWIEVPITFQVP